MGSTSSMPSNRAIPLSRSRLWRAKCLDHGVDHLMRFGLAYSLMRRTEGSRGDLDGLQYHGTHRPGLLPKKPLRCCGPVTALAEDVVHGRLACALSRVIESSPRGCSTIHTRCALLHWRWSAGTPLCEVADAVIEAL